MPQVEWFTGFFEYDGNSTVSCQPSVIAPYLADGFFILVFEVV